MTRARIELSPRMPSALVMGTVPFSHPGRSGMSPWITSRTHYNGV
jgi:hypothetical protein